MTATNDLRRMQIADARRRPRRIAAAGASSLSSGSASVSSARCGQPTSQREQSPRSFRSHSRDSGMVRNCRWGMMPRDAGLDQAFSTYLPHLATGRRKTADPQARKSNGFTADPQARKSNGFTGTKDPQSNAFTGTKDNIRAQLENIRLSSEPEKKCALKCLLVKWHPDKNQADPEFASDIFKFIQSERTRLKI